MRKYEKEELEAIEATKDFLCGYRLCMDLLGLRRYERKRLSRAGEECMCADVLAGDEAYWRARMHTVGILLGKMKNGREKLMLYYHFIKGESIDRIAAQIGVSRRTGFRIYQRALLAASKLLEELKKTIS